MGGLIRMDKLPINHPEYGGILIYYKNLNIGDKFFVRNGYWDGEIIEVGGCKKLLVNYTGDIFDINSDNFAWIELKNKTMKLRF